MSYIPLARKYRPSQFEDLVGQNALVKALCNAIQLKREPQAVIFTGVRGIGKTTVARLYAKALNCEEGPTSHPCDKCDSCLAIKSGNHEDVLEVDGASHTGVDDVRELQESLSYSPQRSTYRVFIIDEVHMLSQSAFNALLKTLEELPEHVVFLFATTELHKVPPTILSRCQTFHLQCLSLEQIRQRISSILDQEKIPYDPGVIQWVAQEGHGSMRDALTFLDQAIAVSEGHLTLASLKGLISVADSVDIVRFLDNLLKKNAKGLLSILDAWEKEGLQFTQVLDNAAIACRHAFVIKELGADCIDLESLGLDPNQKSLLSGLAEHAKRLELNQIFRVLVQARKDLSGAGLDKYILENHVFEWCLDPGLPSWDQLEQLARKGHRSHSKIVHNNLDMTSEQVAKIDRRFGESKRTKQLDLGRVRTETLESSDQPVEKAFPESWKKLIDRWKALRPLEARMLEECYLFSYSRQEIHLTVLPGSMVAGKLLQKEVMQAIQQRLRDLFDFSGRFLVTQGGSDTKGKSLLDERVRLQEETHAKIKKTALSHPITQEALRVLNGDVENVDLR